MKTIRYGVIGTGAMGREHIGNILALPGAEVVALSDPNEWSLRTAQEMADLPDEACHLDDDPLIEDDSIDALVVATPNHTHAHVMVDAMASNAHILIEKPLGRTVAECDRIIEEAAKREPIVWMGLEYRYMPPITRLIEEVRNGIVGKPEMVAIREHRYPFLPKVENWNRFSVNTGGTLVEKCCHFFDLMNQIINGKPQRVYATGSQAVNHLDEEYDGKVPDIIDNAYVIVDYDNGTRAMLDLCMFAEASKNEQEIAVTGALGKIEAFVPEHMTRIGLRSTGSIEELEVRNPDIEFEGHHWGSSYLEHVDFVEAIRTGGSPKVTLEEGRMAVAIGVAGHKSIDEGRPVMMDEVL